MACFGGSKTDAEGGILRTGDRVYEAGSMSGKESDQYDQSFDLGNILKQIQLSQMGMGDAPEGYLKPEQQYLSQTGELGKNMYEQILSELVDPSKYYESTLLPELQIAEDYINRQAQGRGLLKSGIPIEEMGRAGVELAVKEAQNRMAVRSQAQQKAAALSDFITNYAQGNWTNLANMYGQQQQAGLSAKARQSQAAQAAGGYWSYPYQAQLGDYYGTEAAKRANLSALMGAGSSFSFGPISIGAGKGASGGSSSAGGGSFGGFGGGGSSSGGGGSFNYGAAQGSGNSIWDDQSFT